MLCTERYENYISGGNNAMSKDEQIQFLLKENEGLEKSLREANDLIERLRLQKLLMEGHYGIHVEER